MVKFENVWNHTRILQVGNDLYCSKYHPNGADTVEIVGPDENRYYVKTPRLSDWALVNGAGRVTVVYTRLNDDGTQELVVVPSTAECGAAIASPEDGQGGNMEQITFHDRTYRARTQGGEVWLETSLDGGATWAYGTGLGGSNMVAGTYRLFGIGDRLYVAVAVTNGQVWLTNLLYYNDNNGAGSQQQWVRVS